MILKNARVIYPDRIENGAVTVEEGRITAIHSRDDLIAGSGEIIDLKGSYLAPGFVDLHTHGAGGADFMDGSVEDIVTAAEMHLAHGTTTLLPTSLTSSDEDLFLFIENFKKAKTATCALPSMPGLHLEGPYFCASEKGAQDALYLREPERSHYMKIMEKADGAIRRWSIAPELPGALDMLDDLRDSNILFSAAHTDATYDDISSAFDKGLRLMTHFYSGMGSIRRVGGFRVLGAVEAGYLIDGLSLELIADGLHLPPDLLSLIFKCKDNASLTACTDSMRSAGMGSGPSVLGPKKSGQAVIVEDGIAKMPDRSCFAGSVATGDRLLRTLYKTLGLPLFEAVKIVSTQPAALIGEDEIGTIALGKRADLVVFDENINIKRVFREGKPVLRRIEL